MRRPVLRIKILCVVTLLMGMFLTSSAEAFYWPPWPGTNGTPQIGPEPPPFVPPSPPPPFVEGNPPPSPPAPEIPEPSTLLGTLIGLSAVACYRKWHKTRSS